MCCVYRGVRHLLLLFCLISVKRYGIIAAEENNHPCYRKCLEGETRICEYKFVVEEYATMRPNNCKSCTTEVGKLGNVTGCKEQGCIPGGGRIRIVSAVNQQIPGPKIEVCKGDRVVVKVTNHFYSEGAVIHWHGTHQKGTPHMDGTPYLTQCPIQPHTSFVYNFTADTPGTHMWHAHIGYQEADGMFGTMIVRRSIAEEPHSNLYDNDLSEHTMIVWHWFGQATRELLSTSRYHGTSTPGEGLIINGFGGLEDFSGLRSDTFNTIPREVFTVQSGNKYRFRVIYNTAIPCPVQMSIDAHNLLVIASESGSFKPVPVQSIMINGGERYDFVLEANQAVGNYWVRFRGLDSCDSKNTKVHQLAVLHYDTADENLPAGTPTFEDAIADGVLLNPMGEIAKDYTSNELIYVSELENIDSEAAQSINRDPDQVIYVDFKNNVYDSVDIPVRWPQVNSRTFAYPSFPLLTQRDEITRDLYCTDEDVCPPDQFCSCPYLYDIKLHSLVEMIFIDLDMRGSDHPFHLHGGHFHVVALKPVGENISTEYVKLLNENNEIEKNMNGPMKDTVSVPSGGYVVIRFVAENPGFWFFHCHISNHADKGMGFVLKIGDLDEMPETPLDFPRCGNWQGNYEASDDVETTTSSESTSDTDVDSSTSPNTTDTGVSTSDVDPTTPGNANSFSPTSILQLMLLSWFANHLANIRTL
ncbi:uncharacterized protein [Periplaneta americana]|uniref:uncharacterized protein n=1 Tax=Periplaneta americana TaxID=6978 RepID=UPI0037E96749